MKWLKWWLLWLLAGQALGLFVSKPELKAKLHQAQWVDKIKIVMDELIEFNKWLIDSVDLMKVKSDLAFRVERLQDDIGQLTSHWSELNQDKLRQWIDYLKTTTEQLKSDVASYVQDLDEKHQLTEKLWTLKEHISELQSKVTEVPEKK